MRRRDALTMLAAATRVFACKWVCACFRSYQDNIYFFTAYLHSYIYICIFVSRKQHRRTVKPWTTVDDRKPMCVNS